MDAQLKRGMTEALVLSLLKQGDSYGYELIKAAQVAMPLSESSLYPVLKRLESLGAVTAYKQEHAGRLRRYYRRTDKAQALVDSFMDDWAQAQTVYQFIKDNEGEQHDQV